MSGLWGLQAGSSGEQRELRHHGSCACLLLQVRSELEGVLCRVREVLRAEGARGDMEWACREYRECLQLLHSRVRHPFRLLLVLEQMYWKVKWNMMRLKLLFSTFAGSQDELRKQKNLIISFSCISRKNI